MLALARIAVLVESVAVEAREAMRVARKMRRHPVKDHAQAMGVTVIDEPAEIVRGAEPAGGSVIARRLV